MTTQNQDHAQHPPPLPLVNSVAAMSSDSAPFAPPPASGQDVAPIGLEDQPAALVVIIPFFQRTRGSLTRALTSILSQQECVNVEIIIVDDGSPVPAVAEVEAMHIPSSAPIRIIRQANAGPGAARNAGIDAVTNPASLIAFLDSDDEWSPSHLQNARRALSAGFDFYFANHAQPDPRDRFARNPALAEKRHRRLFPDQSLYAFEGDFFDAVFAQSPIHTSSVVYRLNAAPNQRFHPEFYIGEDELFWLRLAQSLRRISFSVAHEVRIGRGVNISGGDFSNVEFGSPHALQILYRNTQYRKSLPHLIPLNSQHRANLKCRVNGLQVAFMSNVLHRLRRERKLDLPLLLRYLALAPEMPLVVAAACLARLRGHTVHLT